MITNVAFFLINITPVMLVSAHVGGLIRNVHIIICKFHVPIFSDDLQMGIHVKFLRNDNFGMCGRKNFNLNI